MSARVKKVHPAFKHGGYSATTLLPGEDPAAFKKLHRDLIAELTPSGTLEHDIVATVAHLVWRKQNLGTFFHPIEQEQGGNRSNTKEEDLRSLSERELVDLYFRTIHKGSDDDAGNKHGLTSELARTVNTATLEGLMRKLDLEDHIDSLIDRCLKRLLFLRGLKSISSNSTSTRPARIQGSPRAA
jgi:hypothetical protein